MACSVSHHEKPYSLIDTEWTAWSEACVCSLCWDFEAACGEGRGGRVQLLEASRGVKKAGSKNKMTTKNYFVCWLKMLTRAVDTFGGKVISSNNCNNRKVYFCTAVTATGSQNELLARKRQSEKKIPWIYLFTTIYSLLYAGAILSNAKQYENTRFIDLNVR